MNKFNKKILLFLLALTLLSPIGFILPKLLHSGSAWGEWSTEEIKKDKGYVPKGMEKNANNYKAPLQDYGNGKDGGSLLSGSFYYVLSGIAGVAIIILATWGLFKFYKRND